ncbi:MAG: hypothetical protein P4L71_18075 [Acetobacteraceae bacterium]|nr:hypothetical protein [Acetobacteraceae bacterium]
MSITEAANRLNVSVDSVRRRLRSGAIGGVRDGRGQWWLDLPDHIQAEPREPSVDQRLMLGMASPLQAAAEGDDTLVDLLRQQIQDLRSRLESAEAERREDKARAAVERDRLLTMIETLTRPNADR